MEARAVLVGEAVVEELHGDLAPAAQLPPDVDRGEAALAGRAPDEEVAEPDALQLLGRESGEEPAEVVLADVVLAEQPLEGE